MGLIICCGCGRQRSQKPVRRGARRCSNCGAGDPRIVHRIRVWHDLEDRDGLERYEARRRTYGGLLWLRDQKGYKPAYADAKFRTIFGERPNGEASATAEPPSAELLAWLARDIARWKARKRAQEKQKWARFAASACESAESAV
jgi:hypothetical protein